MAAKTKTKTKTEAAATASNPLDDDEEAAPPPKRSLKKLILIAAAAVIVIAGGGGGAYFMYFHKKAKEESQAGPVVKPAIFFEMPEVIVNLANSGGDHTQYLKVKIVLELEEKTLIPKIEPVMPRVMDAFQTYMRELRPMDLEGSAGLYRLRDELTRRVNLAITPNRVNAVLFKEIVVQ